MKQTLNIQGMSCSSCVKTITNKVSELDYVDDFAINFATNKALVRFIKWVDRSMDIIDIIKSLWYSASIDEWVDIDESKYFKEKTIIGSILSIPLVLFMMYDFMPYLPMYDILMPYKTIISLLIATIVIPTIGRDFFRWAYSALLQKTTNMYSLITIWVLSAFLYSSYSYIDFIIQNHSLIWDIPGIYYEVSVFLVVFITIWKYIETLAKSKTNSTIRSLIELAPDVVMLKDGDNYIETQVSTIKPHDVVLVRPWDQIPFDGVMLWDGVYIDESMLTGESMPILKLGWDLVISGTKNIDTTFELQVTKSGDETTLSRIISLLESASFSKTTIEDLADTISKYFVPFVIISAIVTFVVWYLVIWAWFESALLIATSVVVIACPCALWLATPTAIVVWNGMRARSGMLIKSSDILVKSRDIDIVVLDKTGTITLWAPSIVSITNISDITDDSLLKIASSLETLSNHPIARAFTEYDSVYKVSSFQNIRWKWLIWEIDGVEYRVWNDKLFTLSSSDRDTYTKLLQNNSTPLIVWDSDRVLGFIEISDTIKPTSRDAISKIKSLWIDVYMLTGDTRPTARYIASKVGIDEQNIYSNTLPEDKMSVIKDLKTRWKVAMIWDGINDSIALAQSDIGISMWDANDIAIESADVVFLKNDLNHIYDLISLSKKTVSKIKQNLFFSFIYNALGIPIAAWVFIVYGLELSPEFAGLAMVLSSISVVLNSLLLRVQIKYFDIVSLLWLVLIFGLIFVEFAQI